MFYRKIGFTFFIFLFICIALVIGSQQPAKGKELTLITATYAGPAYKDAWQPLQNFVDYINERGKGNVHIDFYHSGTLLKAKQLLPGLMQGTADMIFHTDSYIMGTFPILGIFELPFLYNDVASKIKNNTIGSPLYKLINQELAKKNIFMITAGLMLTSEYLWTKNRPIRKPDDLNGLRIRAAGRIEAMVVKTLGGASTYIPSAETYEALSRGTIDGIMSYLGTVPARGLQAHLKYVNKSYFAAYGEQLYIRLDKWKNLPPEIRDLILEAGRFLEKQSIEYVMPYHEKNYWPLIKKAGIEIIEPTPEEEEAFKDKLKPVLDWWKKQLPPGVGERAIKLATE
ncbi:MAG: TRAP transporter substrate-binding protein DctP [Thermodesulfobacteriota bacterium]|nr:TRAP transporter substrate-binding protein DctP [Thermodesulfobacteriota bacterium]